MQVDMPGVGRGGRKNILKKGANQDIRGLFLEQQVGLKELGYMPCRWTGRVETGTRGSRSLPRRGLALPGSLLSHGCYTYISSSLLGKQQKLLATKILEKGERQKVTSLFISVFSNKQLFMVEYFADYQLTHAGT